MMQARVMTLKQLLCFLMEVLKVHRACELQRSLIALDWRRVEPSTRECRAFAWEVVLDPSSLAYEGPQTTMSFHVFGSSALKSCFHCAPFPLSSPLSSSLYPLWPFLFHVPFPFHVLCFALPFAVSLCRSFRHRTGFYVSLSL